MPGSLHPPFTLYEESSSAWSIVREEKQKPENKTKCPGQERRNEPRTKRNPTVKKTLLSTLLLVTFVLLGFEVSYARGGVPLPEPATWLLLGTGAAGVAVAGVVKKRKKK